MHPKTFGVEALEARQLLSLTAVSLSYALVTGHQWTTSSDDGTTDTITVLGKNSTGSWKVEDQSKRPDHTNDTILNVGLDSKNGLVVYGANATDTDTSTDPPTTNEL
jgi:hypothetical protein